MTLLQKILVIAFFVGSSPAVATDKFVSVCDRSPGIKKLIESRTGRNCNDITKKNLDRIKRLISSCFFTKITELWEGDFSEMKNLETISLWNCSIRTIAPKTFHNLPRLQLLELSENSIQKIHSNMFKDLKRLTQLSLNDNQISTLPNMAFAGLDKLYSLSVQNNFIESIHPSAFNDLKNLNNLDLGFNPFAAIQTGTFDDLTYIAHISFEAAINLDFIPDNAFINNKFLSTINVHSAPLRLTSKAAFNGGVFARNLSKTFGSTLADQLEVWGPNGN